MHGNVMEWIHELVGGCLAILAQACQMFSWLKLAQGGEYVTHRISCELVCNFAQADCPPALGTRKPFLSPRCRLEPLLEASWEL